MLEDKKITKVQEENAIKEGLLHIGDIMKQCIEKGCDTEGVL